MYPWPLRALLEAIYHIRFNFRGVKLSWIADFSNFRVFIFADAGSYSLICRFVISFESLSYIDEINCFGGNS